MHRRDAAARLPERGETRTQRRLERAQVEDEPSRPARRQRDQHLVCDPQRRCDHDQVVIECRFVPVGQPLVARHRPGRVRDREAETLRSQEIGHPAAHLAASADDERAAPGARTLRRDARLLLRRERAADQRPEQCLGKRRRHAEVAGIDARTQQHFALASEVPGGLPGCALHRVDLGAERLAFGHDLQELPIEHVQTRAQVFEWFHRPRQRMRRGSFTKGIGVTAMPAAKIPDECAAGFSAGA